MRVQAAVSGRVCKSLSLFKAHALLFCVAHIASTHRSFQLKLLLFLLNADFFPKQTPAKITPKHTEGTIWLRACLAYGRI